MRIGIVNDMRLARESLRRVVESEPGLEVVWQAADGAEACRLVRSDKPDLILMDLVMPGVDGVEATRRIMAEDPCPVLVVTASVSANMGRVYDALGYGALDAVDTPRLGCGGEIEGGSSLLAKIAIIAKLIRPDTQRSGEHKAISGREAAVVDLVVIGSSTGGPLALGELLASLPADFHACVVIAQHVDAAFAPGLAEWLGQRTGKIISLIKPGDRPVPGAIYLAETNDHLLMDHMRAFHYAVEPKNVHYRPSVDIFFSSVAAHQPRPGVAVLLTGMGGDGANGMLKLLRLGWQTIAQDKATSVVWGMPRVAAEIGAAGQVLPIERIGPEIVRLSRTLAGVSGG